MKRVSTAEAKANFDDLITLVKTGETVVVTDEARDFMEMKSLQTVQRLEVDPLALEKLHRTFSGLSIDDILSAAQEGHRY
ncbi:hypothetical protein M2360_003404 [Rhizobium sp. SG_E_25_P2]|uniref:type II toxin-antitoxin system Phd/YefM family antitoxin n=1 Tax=Rhizobium sp. SG_E_25_P2 TaxID=2879942 RepID=UPI00247313F4|nr:type II toxin-antitoxin system Phd/YefM family antitoxin [Rhizobium sp. SG_E_25_P2]MDH6268001.1 hypothetical protein [Rhizobium sp. SG_E_25_P2]